jgi:ElaB/YqjD/DUF883 family membrane-anchored ribosome-binding protein
VIAARIPLPFTFKDVNSMPDIEEMKNKAAETMQDAQDQTQQQGEAAQDKASGAMDGVKKKMDANGDGKFDTDDVKKMGEDAVNKVKGLFKKD